MMRATATRPHRWRILAAALGAGLLLAACSSNATSAGSSPSSSPTSAAAAAPSPTPTSARCQAVAALHASAEQLLHVKIGKGTADEIKSDLANVKEKLTALTAELHGEFQAQTNAVKSAIAKLETAVSDMTAHFSASTAAGVATAVGGVASATSSLLAALAPQCGSASASPGP
jgi:hypothetical protein